MAPVITEENSMDNFVKLSMANQERPNYSLSLLPQMSTSRDFNAPRCGSTGGITSEEEVDDEIINVTDDDDVVKTTTDMNSSPDIFKVSYVITFLPACFVNIVDFFEELV